MKILICDDSAVMRGIIRRVLDQYGDSSKFELVEAKDGEQVLGIIAQNVPDLVFLDWNMPNLDGLGVVKRLRTEGLMVPIVMITSVSDPDRVYEAWAKLASPTTSRSRYPRSRCGSGSRSTREHESRHP